MRGEQISVNNICLQFVRKTSTREECLENVGTNESSSRWWRTMEGKYGYYDLNSSHSLRKTRAREGVRQLNFHCLSHAKSLKGYQHKTFGSLASMMSLTCP